MIAACPDNAELSRLWQGDLEDNAALSLGAHLETCVSCRTRLDSLVEKADPFTKLLRDAALAGIDETALLQLETSHDAQRQDPPLAPPQSPGELGRLGRYAVVKLLGRGGMGAVYEAQDPALQRTVALKVMLPRHAEDAAARQRFLREARALAAIRHQHIAEVYDVGDDTVPYYTMPLLAGETLSQRLRQESPLSVNDTVRIAREVAAGLAAAHAAGLVHRDIKPGNIWLEANNGSVKILDFGLVRSTIPAADEAPTASGMIVGTPAYMAPEQVRNDSISARTDLFSLGVVLYQMLTGKLPFTGTDVLSQLSALATQTPPAPDSLNPLVPRWLSEFTLSMLAKEPGQRPPDAAAVIAALESRRPVRPRRRWLIAAGLLAVLALALGSVFFLETPKGVIRVEINDPDARVTLAGTGLTITRGDDKPIVVKPGEKSFTVTRGDFSFDTDSFVLKKGENVQVKVDFQPGVVKVLKDGQVIAEKATPAVDPLRFSPDDQYAIESDNHDPIELPFKLTYKSSYTLECWVRLPRSTITLMHGFNIMGQTQDMQIAVYRERWCGYVYHSVVEGPKPDLDVWTHIAFQRGEKRKQFYLNGKKIFDEPWDPVLVEDFQSVNTIGSGHLVGKLHDIRYSTGRRYDRDFTPSLKLDTDAITIALYRCDEGMGLQLLDSSSNKHHAKLNGQKWVPGKKR